MPFTFRDKTYELDEYGFLHPPDQWDEAFAQGMAIKLGIHNGLTDRHWQIIRYLRRRFIEESFVPLTVMACLDNEMRISEFRSLFPAGYHRGACRMAGINYAFMWKTNPLLTYETTFPQAKRYPLDDIGFLADSETWDEGFVSFVMFELEGPDEPSAGHWRVIRFLREYHREKGTIPTIYEACTTTGLSLEDLYALFPTGYRRGACRVAGLPFFG